MSIKLLLLSHVHVHVKWAVEWAVDFKLDSFTGFYWLMFTISPHRALLCILIKLWYGSHILNVYWYWGNAQCAWNLPQKWFVGRNSKELEKFSTSPLPLIFRANINCCLYVYIRLPFSEISDNIIADI